MADNLHTYQLMLQAIALVKIDQPLGGGDLGLKVADVGDHRYLSLVEDITTVLPAVLVYPQGAINPSPQDLLPDSWSIDYFFYVLLVAEFGKVGVPTSVKTLQTTHLANVFMKSTAQFSDPEAGAQVLYHLIPEVEYNPEEENILSNNFGDNIWASRLLLQISTSTQRVT